MRKDFTTEYIYPSRVPTGIRESPHPTSLAFTHCLRSNPVSPLSVSNRQVILNNLNTDIFDNLVAEVRLDGKHVQLALWDTACVSNFCWMTRVADLKFTSGQMEYPVIIKSRIEIP